jgi:mono/diheme cytochrome c family protein
MKKTLAWIVTILALGAFTGCGGRHSAAGFRLPEDGDIELGKAAFIQLECTRCHTVAGVELPSPTDVGKPVPLGGRVYEVRTDGYLVTSIIHPSHVVTVGEESHMPSFARNMTVKQLVDLVAFLQSTYEVVPAPQATP